MTEEPQEVREGTQDAENHEDRLSHMEAEDATLTRALAAAVTEIGRISQDSG